jgi:hypothetical protein
VVRWQAPTRGKRNAGIKFAPVALACIGAAIVAADQAGHLQLGGAAALAPLALILPWAGLTVVTLVRSSLNWAAG